MLPLSFLGSAGGVRGGSAGYAVGLGRTVQQGLLGMVGAEAQFNKSAGVRCDLGLPPVVRLILGHSCLAAGVPYTGGFAGEIFFPDQSFLDIAHTVRLDALLPMLFP